MKIRLSTYDANWPLRFESESAKIGAALGAKALRLEHAGSTSVPGLSAKPVIDIVLAVADSSDEPAYLPQLETAGYVLKIREPDWYQHRMLQPPQADVNLHVFSDHCEEIPRMLAFRDWLRINEQDRLLYQRTKFELSQREWNCVQDYADAKSAVIQRILTSMNSERTSGRESS